MPTDRVRREGSAPLDERAIAPAAVAATLRTPGIDVARGLAVLGMVLVNYKVKLGAAEQGPNWLVWLSQRLDGRAAALFVVLAGVGISLRSKQARLNPEQHLAFERRALLRRAAVLFVVGLLNLHWWDWDILHCYGLMLVAAAPLLNARPWVLWLAATASVAGAVVLQLSLDYYSEPDFWTPLGAPTNILFNGLYPFFPWAAFLFLGMWLGRFDLDDNAVRRRLVVAGASLAVVAELVDSVVMRGFEAGAVGGRVAAWLNSGYIPPRPGYVLAASGTALVVICLSVGLTRRRPGARWVVALTATGQLAFTLYILHAMAILIPIQHGWLVHPSLALTLGYGCAFYLGSVALSVWWRARFAYGPLELLIRQVTGRVTPAPWGGHLVDMPKR